MMLILATMSCGSNKTNNETAGKNTAKPNPQFEKPIIKYAGITMASKYDTSCGMPLSAGLEDTVQYKNKVYGFCSKECKAAFVKKLITKHKR